MPRAIEDFSAIYSTERVTISFDFAKGLNVPPIANETLLSVTSVSVILVSGADAAPSSRLIGSPSITGTFVIQQIGTLQPGAVYNFVATTVTSAGQTLTTNAHQACLAIT
jgi:hypothetical protein